jgi:hypothetical protein
MMLGVQKKSGEGEDDVKRPGHRLQTGRCVER